METKTKAPAAEEQKFLQVKHQIRIPLRGQFLIFDEGRLIDDQFLIAALEAAYKGIVKLPFKYISKEEYLARL